MTLADLAAALRRFRWLAAGTFTVILLAGIAAAILPAQRYESRAVVSVQPVDRPAGFDSQQAIELVIPPMIARITSAAFGQNVRGSLTPAAKRAPLTIDASNDPGTAIVRVSVQSSTPRFATDGARAAVQSITDNPPSDSLSINTLSPADPASSVKAQRAPPVIGGSFVLAVILALFVASFLHRLKPPLPRAGGFRTRYSRPVLGEIPTAADPAQFDGTDGTMVAEAFRSLAARVRQGVAGQGGDPQSCSVAVTSWTAQEGKSTVATNLARSLAAYGAQVTVIDADLRRPQVHELLGVELTPGLADGPPLGNLRQPGPAPLLDVVAAGVPDRHPSEVVSEMLPLALALLHDHVVIVDTPPMFTAETTTVAGAADYVVLVADFPSRRPQELEEALAELELTGTPVLGVVFNRSDSTDTRGRDAYVYQPRISAQ